MMRRICARKVSDTPKPAASSDARVMRKPDDKCSTDFAKEAWLTDRFRCAANDEMLGIDDSGHDDVPYDFL